MNFDLTETQQDIARLTADVLATCQWHHRSAPGVTMAPSTRIHPAWKELARAGLLSLAIPAGLGGDGLGVLDVAVLLTEVGRRAAYVPALATLMTGIIPVARWGDEALQRELLPAAGAGELILTAAIREPGDPFPARPATRVAGGRVTGTKTGVPYAAQAGQILVAVSKADAAASGEAAGASTTTVVVVDPRADGVTLTRTHTVTGEPEYSVTMHETPVTATLGPATAPDLYRLAIAGACAQADGALAGALTLTRDHVATRQQFGKKLAEFQAVAQQIADIYITARIVHLTTLAAIWKLDTGKDADDDLSTATWWITEEEGIAVMSCHHLHGGIGVDDSYPLPRYSALITDLQRFLGGGCVH